MTTILTPSLLDGLADQVRELARRQLRGIDLDDLDQCRLRRCASRSMPRPAQRVNSVLRALVEHEDDRLLAALGGRDAELRGDRRLAGAGAADDQRAGAFLDAAAQQRVERRDARMPASSRRAAARCSAATSRGNTSRPPLRIR